VTGSFPLTPPDVYRAAASLRGVTTCTPALSHPDLDQLAGRAVVCKAEALQRAGSFKFRGAYNAVSALCEQGHPRGVVGASSGNHAQALALAGRLLGVPVIVVVPDDAPAVKVAGARSHGAKIVTYDRHREDREATAGDLAASHGYVIVPSADAAPVMAGAGTAALELLAQAPDVQLILVPVGGGGLAAGTAVAAKAVDRRVRVIGVEPRTGADTAASLRARTRVTLPEVPGTIADALRHTSPAPLAWEVNRSLLEDVVTVTDGQIARAMRWAFEYLKIVVEPSGAVALAALCTQPGDLPEAIGRGAGKVGVILSGGSVDLETFCQAVAMETT
jgi:threo-3-hydroxy-L-aspartate ammonia-lyase